MAQAKKKTAKKRSKKTTRKGASTEIRESSNGNGLLVPSKVMAAIETLQSAVEIYREEISSIPDDGQMPQELIAIAEFAQRGKGALGDIDAMFGANALRLRKEGSFEEGDYRVDFEVQKGKRAAAWKEVAVENRKLLAEAKGDEDFDEEQYAELVLSNAKKHPDKTKAVIRSVR